MSSPGGLDTEVAVKLVRAEASLRGEALRLRDEGRLLARLSHPGIVRVLDLVVLEGRLALVTELVDGVDLADVTRVTDLIPLRAGLQVISAAADALEAARTTLGPDDKPLGLVHRDIKPTNLRIGRHGDVKLLDFGIARADSLPRDAATDSRFIVGSLAYMAPERFVSRKAPPACDVYGLGCCLFEVATGAPLHRQPAVLADVTAIVMDPERYAVFLDSRMLKVPRAIPAEVRELLRSMLAWDPDRRPTAEAVARACERIADDMPGQTLRAFCRGRAPAPRPPIEGAMAGRLLVEGTFPTGRSPSLPPANLGPPGVATVQRSAAETTDVPVGKGDEPLAPTEKYPRRK